MKYCWDASRFVSLTTFLMFFAPFVVGAELHPGDSIEKSVRAGATETYALKLEAGDLVSLLFTDTGQDVKTPETWPRCVIRPDIDSHRGKSRFTARVL